jgi:hypothetical protein
VFNGKTRRLIHQVQPFGTRFHGGTTLAYDPLRSAGGGGAVLVESRTGTSRAAAFDGRTLKRTALLESPTQRPVLQKYTGIVYNPTWPNWSSFQSQGNIASASGTSGTVTVTVQGNPNWVTDVFGHSGDQNPKLNFSESVLFCPVVGGQPNFGNNVILPILGNTSNTLQVDASQTNLPANFTYYVILTNQLTPSDFATQAFQGLWGTVPGQGNQGRNDLAAFQSAGYNLIRLFNWDPTLGTTVSNPTTPSDLQAHTAFLDAAYSGGSQVMVPVSNYSLSNAQFGWVYLPGEAPPGKSTGQIADPTTSFAFNDPNVPSHIRTSLMQFIQSVTQPATDPNNPTGQARINPAVQSISVGNEIDLGLNVGTPGGGGLPNATEKLLRAEWWMINLRQQLLTVPGGDAVKITAPISNADQGDAQGNTSGAPQTTWFDAFINGVQSGEALPNGANDGDQNPGTTFRENVPGLADQANLDYAAWYFNSLNSYQINIGLTQQIQQYDTGKPSIPNPDWSHEWPGQAFAVPLMLTELGYDRTKPDLANHSPEGTIAAINADQVKRVVDYMNANPTANLLGLTFYKFNDEPNYNNNTQATPFPDAVYGTQRYYPTYNDLNDFRYAQGDHFYLSTGLTPVASQPYAWVNYEYPVYTLYPVLLSDGGQSLTDAIATTIAGAQNKWKKP